MRPCNSVKKHKERPMATQCPSLRKSSRRTKPTTVHCQESTVTGTMKKRLLAILLSCCCLAAAAAGRMEPSDADAIADLARSLVKPPFTWTAGGDACSYEGISCSSSGRVTAINLAGKGLAGTLPSSLSSLTALQSLQLGGNALSGAVPSLRAPVLANLSLDGNNFTSLPEDFPQGMPALQHLSMDNLPLPPWPFPGAIAAGCPSLRTFNASNVSITGPFPAAVANLTSIRTLRLSHNMLTGVIPPVLGKIASLRDISLSNNFLQGPVPQFAAGVAADVISGNGFCLDVPGPCNAQVSTLLQVAEGFGYPISLARSWKGNDPCGSWFRLVCSSNSGVSMIFLDNASLSGTISPAIANLTELRKLELANNSLTGEIPDALKTLPELVLLDVRNNNLTGQVPMFKPSVQVFSDGNKFGESSGAGAAPPGSGQPSLNGGPSSSGSLNTGNILIGILVAVLLLL